MLFPTLYLTIKKKKEFQCFSFSLLPVKFQALKVSLDFSLWFFSDKSYFFFCKQVACETVQGFFCFSEEEKISLHLIPLDQGFLNLWVLSQDYTVKVPAKHFLLCESSKKKFTASAYGPAAESPGNLS